MTEANQEPTSQPTPTSEAPKAVPQRVDIYARVKESLADSNCQVKNAIVERYTQMELGKRTEAVTKVIEKIEALETEARKIRPTFAGYTLDGAPIGEPLYAKEQTEAVKKNKEQQAKLESALEKALGQNDYSKVYELSK